MQSESILTPSEGEQRLTKEEINQLPIRRYEGAVCLIQSAADLAEHLVRIEKERLLGFDTESRPSFNKGVSYPASVLQLAGSKTVYVIQLNRAGFPASLGKILADEHIVKAGVAPARDIHDLQALAPFEARGFADLSRMAMKVGLKNYGLRGLAAALLGFRVSKGAQRTNWASHTLTAAQVKYAATDAWVSREIYRALVRRGLEKENKI